MIQTAPLPAEAVRDTLAAVLGGPAYARGLRETLWNRFTSWIGEHLSRLFRSVGESPTARWIGVAVLMVIVTAVVARIAYVAWASWRAREHGGRVSLARGGRAGAASWHGAEAAAAAGRYTEAAHLLYQELLALLARRDRLRLHEAKTVGDYARELRARSSAAFEGFRAFGRDYEHVVYGLQHCDRERFERLHALALALGEARG